MTIMFNNGDRAIVSGKLREDGIYVSEERISEVLHSVAAAFQQQFSSEADYMINEFVAS